MDEESSRSCSNSKDRRSKYSLTTRWLCRSGLTGRFGLNDEIETIRHIGVMPRTWTEQELREATSSSNNFKEVCKKLHLNYWSTTVDYLRKWMSEYKIDYSHFKKQGDSRTWTDDQLKECVKQSTSMFEVVEKLGLSKTGSVHQLVTRYVRELNLDTSHFSGSRNSSFIPTDKILVKDSTYRSNTRLKDRILKEKLLEYKCSRCGITEWLGAPIVLQLDHVNGNNRDNELVNLRMLCPNCHSQTETYGGRNKNSPTNTYSSLEGGRNR